MALFDLFQPLLNKLKALLGPFGKAVDLVAKFFRNVRESYTKGVELAGLIASEISAWRSFKEDIAFRTGVVSIPRAIDKTRELLDEIIAAWHAIVSLASELKSQLQGQTKDPTTEAEDAIKEIESARGLQDFLSRFPRLFRGLEKALGFIAIVAGALESIVTAIDDLTTIVRAIRDIREEVEHGATIFLQQRNPRKVLKLRDGGSIKIRVGNLHS